MLPLIETNELKELKAFISQLSRKKVYRVIRMLHKHPEGLTASDIEEKLDVSQPEINTSLRFLLKHGYATTNRQGKYIVYTPLYEKFDELLNMYEWFKKT